MTIAFSQDHYWAVLQQSLYLEQTSDPDELFDTIWHYPEHLGQGYWRSIQLRTGLELVIADYHPHKPIVIECPDRHHSLEYEFLLPHQPQRRTVPHAGDYFFSGSGLANKNSCYLSTDERFLEVSVHMEPEIFCAGVSDAAGQLPTALKHLVRDQDQERHICFGHSTAAMQMVLQQMIQCPHQGLTKRIYLESKVWELMALLLEPFLRTQSECRAEWKLKREDVDRVHYAREILLKRLANPPSLSCLARQVGLNECTLKRGFRQVFGMTAFGCLHHYRLEQARQLLEIGDMNVTQVSRAVGFADRSYFAAAFRKKFGLNPGVYLRNRNSVLPPKNSV